MNFLDRMSCVLCNLRLCHLTLLNPVISLLFCTLSMPSTACSWLYPACVNHNRAAQLMHIKWNSARVQLCDKPSSHICVCVCARACVHVRVHACVGVCMRARACLINPLQEIWAALAQSYRWVQCFCVARDVISAWLWNKGFPCLSADCKILIRFL